MHPGESMRRRHEAAERSGRITVHRHGKIIGHAQTFQPNDGLSRKWECFHQGRPCGIAASARAAERKIIDYAINWAEAS